MNKISFHYTTPKTVNFWMKSPERSNLQAQMIDGLGWERALVVLAEF